MANKKIITFVILQISVLIFALSSVFGKFASNFNFLSTKYIFWIALEVILLGVFAIIWQQLIKSIDISIAYANKATAIFWSMLLAAIILKENITIKNIVGVLIIFIGILVVNKND